MIRFMMPFAVSAGVLLSAGAEALTLSHETRVDNPNPTNNDYFGSGVAVSDDWLLIAAQGADEAYLFDRNNLAAGGTLLPGAGNGTLTEWVDLNSRYAMVGAGDHGTGGRTYVYDLSDPTNIWWQLENPSGLGGDRFGFSIEITEDHALIGAPYHAAGGNGSAGRAYLYDLNDPGFHNNASYVPTAIEAPEASTVSWFGSDVAIGAGKFAVSTVGTSTQDGVVYLYDLATPGGTPVILNNPDGEYNDQFGTTIAMNDRFMAVGEQFDNDAGNQAGAVYLYDLLDPAFISNPLTYTPIKFPNPNGDDTDMFGHHLDMNDRYLAIGSLLDDTPTYGSDSGRVYVLDLEDIAAGLVAVDAPDAASATRFGSRVALSEDTLAVGNYFYDNQSGAVQLFSGLQPTTPDVPSPAMAALFALGVLGLRRFAQ